MKTLRMPVIVLLSVFGCKSHNESTNKQAAPEKSIVEKTSKEKTNDAKEVSVKSVEKIRLLATVTQAEGEPQSVELSLDRSESGMVIGQGTLDGIRLKLSGTLSQGQLRLWIEGGSGAIEKVRRGYLIGALDTKGGEGTIAISGNGGVPNYKGEWTRKKLNDR